MMKRFCSLLCAVLMALSLAACGDDPKETTQPSQTEAVQKVPFETEGTTKKYEDVRLVYCTWLSEDAREARAVRQAAEYFRETTGAEVEIRYLHGDVQRCAEALTDGKGDLFDISCQSLAESCRDYALDLTELAAEAGYETVSYEVLRQQVINRCGFLAGIPRTVHLYGVYYSTEVFESCGIEKTPESWEEFLTVCETLKQGGCGVMTLDREKAHLLLELHMTASLGWSEVKNLTSQGGWLFSDAARAAVERAVAFTEAGYMVRRTPAAYPEGQNKMALSNAAMVIASEKVCAEVEAATLMELQWGVFPYPGDGGDAGCFADSDVLVIAKDCAQPQAAFDFAMVLTTGEFDSLYADLSKGIPADPNNESVIRGAGECLLAAQAHTLGLFDPARFEDYVKIWSGATTNPGNYLSALDSFVVRSYG